MKRQEKADRIGEILDDLYPKPPIPLDHTDPYTLLVAVALSAQTTDKTPDDLHPSEVRSLWRNIEMSVLDFGSFGILSMLGSLRAGKCS